VIESIEITINNKKYKCCKDVTLQEIYMDQQSNFRYPIILAKVNNRLRELSTKITEDSKVEFLDLTSHEGNRTHINGLIFIMQYAIRKLYGKSANIVVQHSLDKGIYINVTEENADNLIRYLYERYPY